MAWKQAVASHWDDLQIVSVEDSGNTSYGSNQRHTGTSETVRLVLDCGALTCDLEVELVDAREDEHGKLSLVSRTPLSLVAEQGTRCTYEVSFSPRAPTPYGLRTRTLGSPSLVVRFP